MTSHTNPHPKQPPSQTRRSGATFKENLFFSRQPPGIDFRRIHSSSVQEACVARDPEVILPVWRRRRSSLCLCPEGIYCTFVRRVVLRGVGERGVSEVLCTCEYLYSTRMFESELGRRRGGDSGTVTRRIRGRCLSPIPIRSPIPAPAP